MTDAERRERNRLRSLRWRRAHGIGPRKPAQRPWLALGLSRSTLTTAAREGPRAGRAGRSNGGTRGAPPPRSAARPAAVAAWGAARQSRQDRRGQRGDGGGTPAISARSAVQPLERRSENEGEANI
jgi:hypothetical protein